MRTVIRSAKRWLPFLFIPITITRDSKIFFGKLLFRLHAVRYLKPVISLLASPWFEERKFASIENDSIKKKDLFRLYNRTLFYYAAPAFYGTGLYHNPMVPVDGPDQYAVILDAATVIGGSGLVLVNHKKALYDLKFNDRANKFWYTDEAIRLYGDDFCILDADGQRATADRETAEAIFMGGNYSSNYYHLLFEILVKFELIERLKPDQAIPLLVDRVCMEVPQFAELVAIFNKDNRKLVAMGNGERYMVKKLHYISCPNFIPPNYLNEQDIRAEDVLFNVKTIQYLRENLLSQQSSKVFPERLFISRSKASGRRPFNEEAVFRVLEKHGFVMITPENHSVADQIAMFVNAECVAGGSGAAFANLLFCKPSCKAMIFAKHRIPFSGFSTIAWAIGCELCYFTEDENSMGDSRSLHDPFIIDTGKLDRAMTEWLN